MCTISIVTKTYKRPETRDLVVIMPSGDFNVSFGALIMVTRFVHPSHALLFNHHVAN